MSVANELPTTQTWVQSAPSEQPPPAPAAAPPSSTEILAASIAGAVERQLTQYMSTMSQQVEATRKEAEAARLEMHAEFVQQVESLTTRLDASQQANDRYQAALQAALEERLAEFANHQHQTLTTINGKLASLPSLVQAELPAQFAVVSRGLRDYLEHKTAAVETQIDELHKSTRRIDEQAAAIVTNVNDTVAALYRRMDDGDQSVTRNIEHRLGDIRGLVDQTGADVARQLAEHGQILSQRVDAIDMKMIDRNMAMEERINEHNGVRMANLEATIGRVGSGFDDAMGALSKRLVDLESQLIEAGERMDLLAADIAKVDEDAIAQVKEQMSTAIGEAMLVRIEVDRFIAAQGAKFDSTALRMTEIESQLADTMDVSEAVQLERLEEIERALLELNPNQFVRKVELNNGDGFSTSNHNNSAPPAGSESTSTEPSYSSY